MRTEGSTLPVGTEVRIDYIDGVVAVMSALDLVSAAPAHPYGDSISWSRTFCIFIDVRKEGRCESRKHHR